MAAAPKPLVPKSGLLGVLCPKALAVLAAAPNIPPVAGWAAPNIPPAAGAGPAPGPFLPTS